MNSLANSRLIKILTSEISGNHVTQPPEPANGNSGSGGGVYLEEVQAEIQDTEIAGNTATGYAGGLAACASPLSVSASTISGNTFAAARRRDCHQPGSSATLLKNSTISGNQGQAGGGAYLYKTNDLNLKHLTLAANSARLAAVVWMPRPAPEQRTERRLSRTASSLQNTAGAAAQDLATSAALIDLAYSLVQAPGSATINNPGGGGNLLGLDPLLGALQNNGGPTLTHLPAFNSPVINAGNPAFSAPPPPISAAARAW